MIKKLWSDPSVRTGVVLFLAIRLWLTIWAGLMTTILPVPTQPDETVRPYLGQTQLSEGIEGVLLGPWQRFDTQHYLRIAAEGYNTADSVFPPLYPWLIRGMGWLFGGGPTANLVAALLISNLAALALLILLHKMVSQHNVTLFATRTIVYLALFPTGFFLWAGYTESLFILLAAGSVWGMKNGRFGLAGLLGLLASLTRLTGWVLAVPLAYEIGRWLITNYQTNKLSNSQFTINHLPFIIPPLLPPLGILIFLAYRALLGLPPLPEVYQQFWYQTTALPGSDVWRAIQTLFFNGTARSNEMIALSLDFVCLLFLIATTTLTFRRLGVTYGLYSAMLLLFILLPTSELKPLYSFSRYMLAFFPSFILLAQWGDNPWIHRLILYGSIILWLFFSGQFFIWGWVA